MVEAAIRPSDEQLALLDPFERWTFELVDFVNTNRATKAAGATFLRTAGMAWVRFCSYNLIHMMGIEQLKRFEPERGVILACNHRSFFDMYTVTCWLYQHTDLLHRTYFPVRSEFFYERPVGVFVSLIMSALAMYPPIFRDSKKRDFNTYGLKRLVQLLQTRGNVVGMHPEGTRNKGGDPYKLLPAQPGIGRLIMKARPHVVPIFINGIGNDFVSQVSSNFDGTGVPIVMVVGEPLDLSSFYAKPDRLRTQKQVADFVAQKIADLGDRERVLRAELERNWRRGPMVHS